MGKFRAVVWHGRGREWREGRGGPVAIAGGPAFLEGFGDPLVALDYALGAFGYGAGLYRRAARSSARLRPLALM